MSQTAKIRCLSLCTIVFISVAWYAQEPGPFEVCIVQFGNARIEPCPTEYKGTSLTGVVVEIESSTPDSVALFYYKTSATAKSLDGKSTPPIIIFHSRADDSINVSLMFGGKSTLHNWKIFIDQNEYKAQDDITTMPITLEENGTGIKYTFREKGKVQIGFVFPESLENLTTISLLGKTIKLELPRQSL